MSLLYFKNLFKKGQEKNNAIDLDTLKALPLPQHIAIIMDGNGRWAQQRGLPRAAGHRAGMESLKKIVNACLRLGIPYLTVYAFSTENWKRPQEEVDILMGLLVEYVDKELEQLHEHGVRVRPLGRVERLPEDAKNQILKATAKTAQNNKLSLQIAINYGGRMELVEAIRKISADVGQGKITVEEIDEKLVSLYLYTSGIPDPDLMIRPSGELRVSNFLLWQLAYTEFWSTSVLWPDFTDHDLFQAVHDYQHRHRRYGGL